MVPFVCLLLVNFAINCNLYVNFNFRSYDLHGLSLLGVIVLTMLVLIRGSKLVAVVCPCLEHLL